MQTTRRGAPPPLLTPSFLALLVANVCFGYAFSSFFLLPKFMAAELAAGPVEVGGLVAAAGYPPVFTCAALGLAVAWLVLKRAPEGRSG